jgi:hypothetical protein
MNKFYKLNFGSHFDPVSHQAIRGSSWDPTQRRILFQPSLLLHLVKGVQRVCTPPLCCYRSLPTCWIPLARWINFKDS